MIAQNAINEAKNTDILTLIGNDTTLHGGQEQYGPCPFCGGQDRFHVKDNAWFCRQCTGEPEPGRAWLDAIDYTRRKYQLDFSAAIEYLTGKATAPSTATPAPADAVPATTGRPARSPNPAAPELDWQDRAEAALINSLCENLWHEPKVMAWLNRRGLDDAAIIRYSLGYALGGPVEGIEFKYGRGIVIPHYHEMSRTLFALKVRRPVPDGTAGKYFCATGSKPAASLFNADSLAGQPVCFVVEGELDAIALHSQVAGRAAVVTLGSKGAKLADRWLPDLMSVQRFYIATDANEDEAAADYWLDLVGKRGRRVLPPGGCKDVCEAARNGYSLADWAMEIVSGASGLGRKD